MGIIEVKTAVTADSGRELRLRYTLTDGGEAWYGVRVDCDDGCCAEARELTPERGEAEELLLTLARLSVTPATLRDVAYDWLCAKYTVQKN